MELGPIIRSLINNRTRFWLIALEVGITLAVVVNCAAIILNHREAITKPTGMDHKHLLAINTIPASSDFADDKYRDEVRRRDLERLRAHPGVREATAIRHIPLSGSGSACGRKPVDSQLETRLAVYFVVGERILQTLGVELIAGRDFEPTDFEGCRGEGLDDEPRNVILTQALADKLFPDGDALGQLIENKSGTVQDRIIGIISNMDNSWARSTVGDHTMLRPGRPGDHEDMRYIVRSHDENPELLIPEFEELMISDEANRIVKFRSLSNYKAHHYRDLVVIVRSLESIIVLLIAVTALGVVGLTSFSVSQRFRELGTRRALGATRTDILRQVLTETWIITTAGILFGVLPTYGLNIMLTHFADAPKLGPHFLVAGALLMWVATLAAALAPAFRATTVAPEVATRTV